MIFKIKMSKKEFIMGKCSVRDNFYTKTDFDAAMEEFKDIVKKTAIYIYIANIVVPMLPKEEQGRLMNNTCAGKIVSVDDEYITVSSEAKYPGFEIINKYYSKDEKKMEADFEFMGNIEDHQIKHIHIAKMNIFLSKQHILDLNKDMAEEDVKKETKFFRFDMPMTLKPDENDRYYNRPAWGDKYFTKEKLSNIVNSEKFQERLKNGTVFLTIAPPKNEIGKGMQFNPALIAGYVEDVDVENNKITFLCTSNNFHTQIFINHGDLIGKELFAACMYILSPIKSGLVDTEGNDLCKELDIKDIVCYVLKREKQNVVEENKTPEVNPNNE